MTSKRLTKAQEKAKGYVEEHNIERIISEMLNSLVHVRDPNPIVFMVLFLFSSSDQIPFNTCHQGRAS
jgi:hypothetical protein